jgi:hypothetical protein
MLVIVPLAFGRALVAYPRAQLEHFAKHLFVGTGAPHRELSRGLADIGAIEAGADALAQVHFLRRAGVGAAQAHALAVQQMVGGIAERLVDVPGNVRVKRDHFADGHWILLLARV